jgi:hypothetical protein
MWTESDVNLAITSVAVVWSSLLGTFLLTVVRHEAKEQLVHTP